MAMKGSAVDISAQPVSKTSNQLSHKVDQPVLDETAASKAAACLFNGMGDPSRVAILRHLLLGEHNVSELTSHLGLAQSTVSKHLSCLRSCGLVTSRPVGRSSMFSIVHPEQVLALFVAAEQLLAATGDKVLLCPQSGVTK